jgi:ubiquinone/menaquinone biosynthesis C-methylase UbiE
LSPDKRISGTPDGQIDWNRRAHDAVCRRYERIHGEIFNSVEQQRLADRLRQAASWVRTASPAMWALDLGCGSGNLTGHLVAAGLNVIAADVSPKFLQLVESRFADAGPKVDPMLLNGRDLAALPDQRVDLAAAYSVLHHVPDYLRIIDEMVRVTKPGGVIYLDHEVNESYWQPTPEYRRFLQRVSASQRWSKYTDPANYVAKIRRLLNPRYHPEGDIHVWPDDHIEWDKIRRQLESQGCEILLQDDYLHYKRGYPPDAHEQYRTRCSDMRLLVARRKHVQGRSGQSARMA